MSTAAVTTGPISPTYAKVKEAALFMFHSNTGSRWLWYLFQECTYFELGEDAPVKTACVTFLNGRPAIGFHPGFVASKPVEEIAGVLTHEVKHLTSGHLTERWNTEKYKNSRQRLNAAMDIVVNQGISILPAECCTLESMNAQFKLDMLPGGTTDYYFDMLASHEQQMPQDFDGHGDGDVALDAELENRKRMIFDALQRAKDSMERSGGAGTDAGALTVAMDNFTKANVEWERHIQEFVSAIEQVDRVSTRKRMNRRTQWENPGVLPKRMQGLFVALDVSGSMWTAETMSRLGSELLGIVESGVNVCILPFDTSVTGEFVLEDAASLTGLEVKGGGGTVIGPVFEYLEAGVQAGTHVVDGLLVLTDGCIFDQPPEPGYPVLWGILSEKRSSTPECTVKWAKSLVPIAP